MENEICRMTFATLIQSTIHLSEIGFSSRVFKRAGRSNREDAIRPSSSLQNCSISMLQKHHCHFCDLLTRIQLDSKRPFCSFPGISSDILYNFSWCNLINFYFSVKSNGLLASNSMSRVRTEK